MSKEGKMGATGGEIGDRFCSASLLLTEPINQLLMAPTLAAFEEKVLKYLPKEQEQK